MSSKIVLCAALLFATVACTRVDAGDPGVAADTGAPNVAGSWRGTWSHRSGSGRITLRLAQEGNQVTGRQSLVSVTSLFSHQTRRRLGQQVKLGRDIRDGHIEDSTLMFYVQAPDLPGRQVNFTLTVTGETMSGTMCADTCANMTVRKSNR